MPTASAGQRVKSKLVHGCCPAFTEKARSGLELIEESVLEIKVDVDIDIEGVDELEFELVDALEDMGEFGCIEADVEVDVEDVNRRELVLVGVLRGAEPAARSLGVWLKSMLMLVSMKGLVLPLLCDVLDDVEDVVVHREVDVGVDFEDACG
eukprot:2559614-Amphidinium_carterae.2